jgi:hypothetical protein
MRGRAATVAWCLTGVPVLVAAGWVIALQWHMGVVHKAQTLGDGLGPIGAVLDIFAGVFVIIGASPVLLLGPAVGLAVGVAVAAFIQSELLRARARAWFGLR